MLAELETQDRKEAYHEFVVAVWESAEPSQLLAMARAAGLSGQEADDFVARVAQAREQLAETNRLPRLRKEAARLSAQHDRLRSRAAAEISRLEDEVQEAALEADAAQRAVNEADGCARQLLQMHDTGELPVSEVPDEVFLMIERRNAEAHYHQMSEARITAENRRNNARALVRNLEYRLEHLPMAITRAHDETVLENQLKDAKRQLAEAESALRTAVSAEDAARRATS